jgi:antitoxin VapB
MALSIKTKEADELARWIARRTGESMTEAVTVALRERRERLESRPPLTAASILASAARFRAEAGLDTRPLTEQEWDEASSDAFQEVQCERA